MSEILPTIAADLGFGNGKGSDGVIEILVPSVVGQTRNLIDSGLSNRSDLEMIVDLKRDKFVGELALRQSPTKSFSLNDRKVNHESTLSILEFFLGALAQTDDVNMVSGLPVTYYFNQKQELEDLLKGSHHVNMRIGTKKINRIVNVGKVKVVPQPFGSALDFLLDDNGQIKEEVKKYAVGRIGIVDVGFYSNDLLLLHGLEIIQDHSRSLQSGMSLALKAMNDSGIDLPIYQLDKEIRQGNYQLAANKAFKGLAEQIMGEVQTYFPKDLDLIIVTGGGGQSLHPFFNFNHETIILEDSVFANVRGYNKLATRLWG